VTDYHTIRCPCGAVPDPPIDTRKLDFVREAERQGFRWAPDRADSLGRAALNAAFNWYCRQCCLTVAREVKS
jgi:hypothetical protein